MSLLSKIASSVRGLINYDAFSILLVDAGAASRCGIASAFATIERVNIDNISLGKGITGAAATSGEIVRVHDTGDGPSLHCFASVISVRRLRCRWWCSTEWWG